MAKDRFQGEAQERPAERVEEQAEDRAMAQPRDRRPEERDCRSCKHYPLKRKGINTTMASVMKDATEGYTKTFCGTKPEIKRGKLKGQPMLDGVDCTGKNFEKA
jgi:hypothetical protein